MNRDNFTGDRLTVDSDILIKTIARYATLQKAIATSFIFPSLQQFSYLQL